MSTMSGQAPPPFSYAQAARGLQSVAIPSQKSSDVSTVLSEKEATGVRPSTEEEKVEARASSSESKLDSVSSQPGVKFPESPQGSSSRSRDSTQIESAKTSRRTENLEEGKTTVSPTIPSMSEPESFTNRPDEDSFLGANGASDTSERQSEVSMPLEKATQATEKTKSQSGDDDWEKVSVPSASQEKELKAAPPPTVNFWQQRMQAQEAKQREQASQRPAIPTGKTGATSNSASDVPKPKTGEKVVSNQERDATKRKAADTNKTTAEKSSQPQSSQGRPSSRGQQSSQNLPPPPPVGDATAWPTPETAVEAEDRRRPSIEVNDKSEVKPAGAKQQKKWTQVPFVPTAVFNTPLPPAAVKRGNRTNVRGNRENAGRGGHLPQSSMSAEKTDLTGSMGPPPVPRQGDQERGRRQEGSRGGRATSVPTQGRRAASATASQAESRKVSGTRQPPTGSATAEASATRKAQGSRSSSRPTDGSSKAAPNGNNEVPDSSTPIENTHGHPVIDPSVRGNIPSEWYAGDSSKPTSAEHKSREHNGKPRTRTFQESKEKVDSWRDRDSHPDTNGRRESRPERGGRGSYRGRGNNPAYAPAPGQVYSSPLPQQPFAPHKSHSYNESRQRQTSQPQQWPMQPLPATGGNTTRSRSIPMPQHSPNSMLPLSPIQTDVGMYGFYPPAMLPAYVGSVPHHPALDMYGLMALVTAQLEYYFSIDNLCHDMYLRKHMDSQGFVSLAVIASFKRITSLTPDMDLLRASASQSKIIEVRQGDDGCDRLRRREGWEQWVLASMEERDPAARNAGPNPSSYQPRRPAYSPYPYAESPYPMGGPMQSPSWNTQPYNDLSSLASPRLPRPSLPNDSDQTEHAGAFQAAGLGLNGEHEREQVSSEFVHGNSASSNLPAAVNGTDSSTVTNGHIGPAQVAESSAAPQENIFPNEKVSSVWVYARKGDDEASPFVSHTTRTLSHGSRGGPDVAGNGMVSPTFLSGLRGGAASPEQIHRVQSRDQPPVDSAQPTETFFLKDGVSQSDFDREGTDPWPYQTLHFKAVEQRDQGLHGSDNHEMEILYQFWPSFLRSNFNLTMYKDFYRFALEDLSHGSTNGSTNLAKYYGYQLSATKPLSEQLAHDIVAAIGQENGDTRPVFQKLRSFWRDGAFNFKSRKRIDNLLDTNMREELGR